MNINAALRKETETLAPSSFALVMSTGIISIASHLLDYRAISNFLFYLNNIEFGCLLVLFGARAIFFFPAMRKDLSEHAKGAGFLSITAASCMLGLQYVLLKQEFAFAVALWFFAVFCWLLFMYTFIIGAVAKNQKPSLEQGLNGIWLLLVVSTQSLSIVANSVETHLPFPEEVMNFIAFSGFLLGFMLYIIFITLIFQRLIFSPLKPQAFTPPDWIDMGAAAITCLSGATLVKAIGNSVLFTEMVPFMKAITILCWVVATWWIPVIFILELRRHFLRKNSFKYQSAYWSLVFPLGVYTVCTIRLSEMLPLDFIHAFASKFIFIALIAWAIIFIAMCNHVVKLCGRTLEDIAD